MNKCLYFQQFQTYVSEYLYKYVLFNQQIDSSVDRKDVVGAIIGFLYFGSIVLIEASSKLFVGSVCHFD